MRHGKHLEDNVAAGGDDGAVPGDRELLGRTANEIFSRDSALGSAMLDAFRLRHSVAQREIETPNCRRVQVSLDFIHEKGTQIGASELLAPVPTGMR